MSRAPSMLKGSKKGEKVKSQKIVLEDLNRILNELFDLCLAQNRVKRVQEKWEASERFNLKKRELENFIEEVMKSPGTGIKIYEKLNRLLNRVLKHRPSVQYLILNGIVEKIAGKVWIKV
ncbi:hypothetical protein ES702_05681 [subsurface metagenome]